MTKKAIKTLAMVLAGGKGERLYPLTEHRTKPAVPFGGIYRLIDFVLSNLVNSGIHQIYVLTQYKAQSLLRHLQQGWVGTYPMNGLFILPVPAQMRVSESWYLGTTDAIFQNIYLIQQINPDLVLVFGADHVYFVDVSQMIDYHLEKGAEITIATVPYPITECGQFGVVVVDETWRVTNFQEKGPRSGERGWGREGRGGGGGEKKKKKEEKTKKRGGERRKKKKKREHRKKE